MIYYHTVYQFLIGRGGLKPELEHVLAEIAGAMPLNRFFLPDGKAYHPCRMPVQPYDRLLFLVEGVKREPFSLCGEIRTVELRCGDVWLVARNFWEFQSWEEPHRLFCIVPRNGYLRISLHDNTLEGHRCIEHHTGRPVPEPLTAMFAALLNPDYSGGAHVFPLIRAVAALALEECRRPDPPRGKAIATFDRACRLVEENFSGPLTREQVAAALGLNPTYLSMLFRRMAGKSFHRYLLDCRIEMAKNLLRTTTFPIKEVAAASGFSGEVHFIRRFREVTGRTPGRFRLDCRNVN